MASIYLHIPVCRRICGYCDFFRTAKVKHLPALVNTMLRELDEEQDFLSSKQIDTIYFGGGTPSLLSVEQIEMLLHKIHSTYDCSALSEVTLEANPDDLNLEYLRQIRQAGINRLSIGIQSFDEGALKLMNRRHGAEQAQRSIEQARTAGFDNIAADLIFGIHGYGNEKLRHSIDELVRLDVEHIAAYHLTIESGTVFEKKLLKGEMQLVDEEQSEKEFMLIHEKLIGSGYEHYEVSNFAKPNFRSRHNSAYWQGSEYLGIGAGAHSFAKGKRRWTAGTTEDYLQATCPSQRYEGETLSIDDERREMIMTRLRCSEGLCLDTFNNKFGEKETRELLNLSQKYQKEGLIKYFNNRLCIPAEHFLRSDMLIGALF